MIRFKLNVTIVVILAIIALCIFSVYLSYASLGSMDDFKSELLQQEVEYPEEVKNVIFSSDSQDSISSESILQDQSRPLYSRVHVFYYNWYANPETDGGWAHWNHRVLPHWDPKVQAKYPDNAIYSPPAEIGANYYPLRGLYSSMDRNIVVQHFKELKDYVIVFSWWGRGTDGEGYSTEIVTDLLFEVAEELGCKLAFHLEPYEGRNSKSILLDMKFIFETYGSSEALYIDHISKLPLFYVYDSYLLDTSSWIEFFDKVRGTEIDAIFLGLYRDEKDKILLESEEMFDGVYTYFAADKFTSGSNRANWHSLSHNCAEKNKMLSISVGPGYIDERVRPWNSMNTKSRMGGDYYRDGFQKAIDCDPDFISITSYNEWHEGTQIEAVMPADDAEILFKKHYNAKTNLMTSKGLKYQDYSPHSPSYYIELTREFSMRYMFSEG